MIPGITAQEPPSSSSPSPPFSAGATTFDNTSTLHSLTVASQTQSDTPQITISSWYNLPTSNDLVFWQMGGGNNSNFINDWNVSTDFSVILRSSVGATNIRVVTDSGYLTANTWHHIFVSANTNFNSGSKIVNVWIDGAAATIVETDDLAGAFDIVVNGQEFGLPIFSQGTSPFLIGIAEYWCAYGVTLDPTTYVPKFRNSSTGEPVSLGSDGSTPTGSAPDYYFSGSGTAFGTNRGTGQQPTINGTLTAFTPGP